MNQFLSNFYEKVITSRIQAKVYGQGQCSDELFDIFLEQSLTRPIEISKMNSQTNLIIINGLVNDFEKKRLEQDLLDMTHILYLLILGRHQIFSV